MMTLLTINSECRTFDVNDTGRISESKFRQILATKQVPKDDVDGILEGEKKASALLSNNLLLQNTESWMWLRATQAAWTVLRSKFFTKVQIRFRNYVVAGDDNKL